MNRCIFMGRFAADPEIRYTQDNTAVVRGRLALNRSKGDEADFINIVGFGKTAENIQKYFLKGNPILIESHVQVGSYTNKEGRKVTTHDFVIDHWEFVGSKSDEPKKVPDGEFVDVPEGSGEDLPWT